MGSVSRVAALCLAIAGTTATSAVALSSGAWAQEILSGGVIKDIRVEGTQRIEQATVRSYLVVSQGDAFNPDKIDESLKALFATGLFADVTLRRDGDTLVVAVVENPIINRVVFEGNKRVKTEDLQSEVQLRSRLVFTRSRVQQDVQRMLDVYRRNGRFAARIEPKIVQLEQNRVDLVFEIDEGPLTGVQLISFINNNIYDDSELRDVMVTKESRWWRFLSSDDTYDPDRLAYDKEQIRRFYFRNGYPDFRVMSSVAELTPSRDKFFITMALDEGKRYKFGKIELTSAIKDIDLAPLREVIETKEGDWFNADKIESTINKLQDKLGDQQYAFVQVDPNEERHADTQTVDLHFEINPSPRVFVERIDINGNLITLDKVVRRELLLAEGDPFNASKVKRSEQRVKDLGFFDEVKIKPSEGSTPDQAVLTVDLSEQSTGEIQVGLGYSTTEGALIDFSIRQRNFLGTGQDIRFSTMWSYYSKEFTISYTDPYFMNRDLAMGVDLFRTDRNANTTEESYSYDMSSTGFDIRAGFPISDRLRELVTYTLSHTRISDITYETTRFVQEQVGATTTSSVQSALTFDARDSRLKPTSGYYFTVTNQVAGLGGSVHFLRNRLTSGIYFPLFSNVVLKVEGEIGYILGLGGEFVRIQDRFFLGGDTLRGFQVAGVGPRAFSSNGGNDALGGKRLVRGTSEVTFPLGLPEELGVDFHVFTDIGALDQSGESPLPGDDFHDEFAFRASSGVGVSWKSPFGPIRIDLAYPWMKKSYDRIQQFRFSFGSQF
ncbi:Beta-barrel assembly machine subunit BamA [Nitrospirillum amazonense]|uniref:Outer membrane protein assembly factor BamA n=1 Tax=Nitrospirillum amazonense TaxID=28077 RepID=A0A560K901_9PROT|nr:outer membrane protein assembly factor BamA [Nitrospirillum amazonense]TWB79811.1 Beta-barrel assembly machine subunit BamA [Nitrospirillum amazonense]